MSEFSFKLQNCHHIFGTSQMLVHFRCTLPLNEVASPHDVQVLVPLTCNVRFKEFLTCSGKYSGSTTSRNASSEQFKPLSTSTKCEKTHHEKVSKQLPTAFCCANSDNSLGKLNQTCLLPHRTSGLPLFVYYQRCLVTKTRLLVLTFRFDSFEYFSNSNFVW